MFKHTQLTFKNGLSRNKNRWQGQKTAGYCRQPVAILNLGCIAVKKKPKFPSILI